MRFEITFRPRSTTSVDCARTTVRWSVMPIARHGKPAAILHPVGDEDDWLEYRLRHDPRLRARLERSRRELNEGKGVRMEDLPPDFWTHSK